MREAATDVIAARLGRRDDLAIMLCCSLVAHGVLGVLVAFLSHQRLQAQPRVVMTISLSGAGFRTGGLTPMGGPTAPLPDEGRPLKSPPPSVVETTRSVRPQPPRPSPREPEPRPSTVSEPIAEGPTRTDTRVRGQGFGLSGGGGTTGGPVQLDVSDFCCPEYVEQMVPLIQRHWDPSQGIVGTAVMKFTILRDGTIQDIQLERGSGFVLLDNAAQRALALTRLPALPPAFPNQTLTVHMRFEYHR